MRTLNFGYEHTTETSLSALLGDQHWSRELTVTTAIPYAERPGDYGNVETTRVDRRAVIIEGTADLVNELLGDGFQARLQAIHKRTNGHNK